MKRVLLNVLFLIIFTAIIQAQAPSKFNYQAVIRDNSDELITNQNIKLKVSIINEGLTIYTEEHSVTTNLYGIVNIKVGEGDSPTSDFDLIDWGTGTKSLNIEIDEKGGSSFTSLGKVQLLSVPYALHANSANQLGSQNIYSPNSDTLFVVKDYDGNVVFAVFPDGAAIYVNETAKGKIGGFAVSGRTPSKAGDVDILKVTLDSTRIYVSDTINSKGKIGGFAVSGRTPSKSSGINDYLVITPDSARIYVNDTITSKGKIGGFAVSGRTPSKGTETDYFNVSGSSEAEIINPSEARIVWYPNKEAFLTGRVLIESPDSIGTNSMATGFESKAIGNYSQAFGYMTRAKGLNSTAIGNNANAEGRESYAFGNNANTSSIGTGSYAIGSGAVTEGVFSFALGSTGLDSEGYTTNPTKASGNYAYAFGMGSVASDNGAFAFGTQDTASGKFCTAIGVRTKASELYSTAIGHVTTASGIASTAMGEGTVASGSYSTAIGKQSVASKAYSTAIGAQTIAGGMNSTAMGWSTTANGNNSTAMGALTQALGNNSTALGYETLADSTYAIAMGFQTTASGYASTAMGFGTTADSTYAIAMGCETAANGFASVAMGRNTTANESYSVAMGYNTTADVSSSTAMGNSTIASGVASTAMGFYTVASGGASLSAGLNAIALGDLSTAIGENTIAKAYSSFVVGHYNDTLSTSLTNSFEWEDPIFIIGNGAGEGFRNNAMMVKKNGEVYFPDIYGDDIGASVSLYINSEGQLGTVQSAKRYKKQIIDMENVDWLYRLRPVNFSYKNDEKGIKQYGFIAEEVETVNPLFVSYNKAGEIETVQYSKLMTPMIKAIQDQQKIIEEYKSKVSILEQRLTEIEKLLQEIRTK